MPYQPGLHIIAELSVNSSKLLNTYQPVKACIDHVIADAGLQNLGDVYHNFTPHGFTAIVCLSESHLSLHSWPEHQRLHLDVYLSNFLKNNDAVTRQIFNTLVEFFDATIINQQTLQR